MAWGPQCDALELLPCRAAACLQGSGAPQESKVCGGGEVEPPAASTESAAGSLGAASDRKLCRSDLNNSGRGPSRRVPRWREASGCPASDRTRDEAARLACGLSAKVSAAGAPLWPHADAHRSRAAARRSHRFHQKRRAPLGQRSPAAARLTDHLPTTRDDDQGPAAAQVCPHHNMHNRLPRRPRQWGSVLRPRRVCGTRFQGN
jgi:hypothetical protein